MSTKTKKNTQDLSAMSEEVLLNTIEETELRLRKMEFSHAITPVENPMSIRILRREIARLKTQLRRTELGF
ncbi:MAG: 50S ribosomal protein L29 [Bacteroidetes bacterium]|nr:50S ribosomal protein L29 [Bacteroidota bacterium]